MRSSRRRFGGLLFVFVLSWYEKYSVDIRILYVIYMLYACYMYIRYNMYIVPFLHSKLLTDQHTLNIIATTTSTITHPTTVAVNTVLTRKLPCCTTRSSNSGTVVSAQNRKMLRKPNFVSSFAFLVMSNDTQFWQQKLFCDKIDKLVTQGKKKKERVELQVLFCILKWCKGACAQLLRKYNFVSFRRCSNALQILDLWYISQKNLAFGGPVVPQSLLAGNFQINRASLLFP